MARSRTDRLVAQRDQIATWLAENRGLRLKDPTAEPVSSLRPMLYLGHRVTREEIRLGPKARQRLPRRLRLRARDPERLRAALQSYAAMWSWGT